MGNWAPNSFVAETFKVTSRHVPPPPNVPPPSLWGDDAIVRRRFGDQTAVQTQRIQLKFNFPFGAERTVDFFRQYFGPTAVAFSRLDEPNQQALRTDLIKLYTDRNQGTPDAVVVDMEYLEVHARKRT
jgi:hypothetical protein